MPIVIANLPIINGEIEAGIVASIDPSLEEAKKMPVLRGNKGLSKSMAVRWAFKELGDDKNRMTLAVNAATAIHDLRLLAEDDSDVQHSMKTMQEDPT